MNRFRRFLFLMLVPSLFILASSRPVFADIPEVRNAVSWSDGSNTFLNVTVYHNQETSFHHVDWIKVSINGDSHTFTQDPHVLDSSAHTFAVTLNLSSIVGNPTATVQADCNIHGSSSLLSVVIPEFPVLVSLLTLVLATSFVILVFRKARLCF